MWILYLYVWSVGCVAPANALPTDGHACRAPEHIQSLTVSPGFRSMEACIGTRQIAYELSPENTSGFCWRQKTLHDWQRGLEDIE